MLITVSGTIPADLDAAVVAGQRPRADYRVLAERLGGDLVDVPAARAATGRTGAVIHRLAGTGALLAWYVLRHRRAYAAVLTDGEQVGLPYAALTRVFGRGTTRHVMIVHVLSTRSKRAMLRWLRLASRIDCYVVYATRQAELLTDEFAVPPGRVVVSRFMVDTEFFAPRPTPAGERPLICSAGLERRDYPTLIEAARDVDADVVIAAASPWSTQSDSTEGQRLPDNVRVTRFDLAGLRELYASADLVVMPLVDVEFQAGITTILEAMAMGRPVVCTRTPGQTDTIVDDETGVYVPPGDPAALRDTIVDLLGDRARRERLGAAARRWAVEHADVERYADRLATVIVGSASSSSSASS